MNKIKSLLVYGGATFSNIIAWAQLNMDDIVKITAIGAAIAAIITAILQSIRIRSQHKNDLAEKKIKVEELKQEILKTKMLQDETNEKLNP